MTANTSSFAAYLPRREVALKAAMALDEIQVLIIGGGINGAAAFRDLALQGIKALIIDQLDWGAGASMASSRMAHGGLRYLENGEFRLTAEATNERNHLLYNVPHMIRPLPMAIPFFSFCAGLGISIKRLIGLKSTLKERGFIMVKIGLLIYDWFGRHHRRMPLHHALLSGVHRVFPSFHPAIRAALVYYDAVIDAPERVALELISDALAACPENIALNRCVLDGFEDGKVLLCDRLSGQKFALRPQLVLNAAGAWIDNVNQGLKAGKPLMGGTKGSHLVIDHIPLFEALSGHGMIFDDGAGRVCIVYPLQAPGWEKGKVLLGSTDIPVTNPDKAHCTNAEQGYLLKAIRIIFPAIDVGEEHVIFRFCGVRPLPYSDATTPGAVTRDHSLPAFEAEGIRHFPILSLVGGKWTTFRAFAAEVCDVVLERLGAVRRVDTSELPIGGGHGLTQGEGIQHYADDLAIRWGLHPAYAKALVNRYGHGAEDVVVFLAEETDCPLPGAPFYTEREIRRLARYEMAVGVDDVIFRRTTLAFEGLLSMDLLQRVAAILAEENNQSEAKSQEDLAQLIMDLQKHHAVRGLSVS